MVKKLRTSIQVSGSDVQGDAATVGFTSDAIPFKNNENMTLSFFFSGLTLGGLTPTLSIEESNSTDVDGFRPVKGATDVDLPEFFKNFVVEADYIRIIFNHVGSTGGTIDYVMYKVRKDA